MTPQELNQVIPAKSSGGLLEKPSDQQLKTMLDFLLQHPWMPAFAYQGRLDLFKLNLSGGEINRDLLEEEFGSAVDRCYLHLTHFLQADLDPQILQAWGKVPTPQETVQEILVKLHTLGYEAEASEGRNSEETSLRYVYDIKSPQGFVLVLEGFIQIYPEK